MSASARARSGIAHVPEGRGIFYGLTVAEHFRLGHRGERLDEELAYTYFPKLKELRQRRSGLLSGGEQQMLAIGRALARNPHVLLLDELSLGLAPVIVESLLPIVRDYAQESGCAVLLVEQHVHLALEVANRGYVLSHGDIVLHKPAEELRRDHHLLIASYLGEHTEVAPSRPTTVVFVARYSVRAVSTYGTGLTIARSSVCTCGSTVVFSVPPSSSPQTSVTSVPGSRARRRGSRA